jgi:hypothetical protein
VPYQHFEVPANFAEDRYIEAWRFVPAIVSLHHLLIDAPAEGSRRAADERQQARLQRMFGGASANAAPAAPRPTPPFSFECCVEIPAGQSGGRPLPPEQRKDLGPNYRPRPAGTGPTMGGYSPGGSIRVFPEGCASHPGGIPLGSRCTHHRR